MTYKIPIWIMIWGTLVALLNLGFVLVAYLHPEFYGHDWAAAGLAKYGDVYGFYVSRNLAMSLVTLLALVLRNPSGLILIFALRIFTDVTDVVHGTIAGTMDMRFVIDAAVLIIISGLAIYKLSKIERGQTIEAAE